MCVSLAYGSDIFVLGSIALSPGHELWKCLEVTKYSLKARDTFIELWVVTDVCHFVCVSVIVCNFVWVNPPSPWFWWKDTDLFPHLHFSSQPVLRQHFHHILSCFCLLLTCSCHNKTNWRLRVWKVWGFLWSGELIHSSCSNWVNITFILAIIWTFFHLKMLGRFSPSYSYFCTPDKTVEVFFLAQNQTN